LATSHLLYEKGEYRSAMHFAVQAVRDNRRSGNGYALLESLLVLSDIARRLAHYQLAEHAITTASQLATTLPPIRVDGRALVLLASGQLKKARGDYVASAVDLTAALAALETVESGNAQTLRTQIALAGVLNSLGAQENAIAIARRAIALARSLKLNVAVSMH